MSPWPAALQPTDEEIAALADLFGRFIAQLQPQAQLPLAKCVIERSAFQERTIAKNWRQIEAQRNAYLGPTPKGHG